MHTPCQDLKDLYNSHIWPETHQLLLHAARSGPTRVQLASLALAKPHCAPISPVHMPLPIPLCWFPPVACTALDFLWHRLSGESCLADTARGLMGVSCRQLAPSFRSSLVCRCLARQEQAGAISESSAHLHLQWRVDTLDGVCAFEGCCLHVCAYVHVLSPVCTCVAIVDQQWLSSSIVLHLSF